MRFLAALGAPLGHGKFCTVAPMDQAFNSIQNVLKRTDDLLRRLEKSSKFLTQYVYTSVSLQRAAHGQAEPAASDTA